MTGAAEDNQMDPDACGPEQDRRAEDEKAGRHEFKGLYLFAPYDGSVCASGCGKPKDDAAHQAPPVTKAGRAGEGLTFAQLQAANVARCVNGFKHTLASWSVAEWTNAMCGEAGEAANVAKKMLRHRDNAAGNRREDTDLAVLRVKLGRELADTVIYACLTAASQGLDLGECVRETFNLKSDELGAKERL